MGSEEQTEWVVVMEEKVCNFSCYDGWTTQQLVDWTKAVYGADTRFNRSTTTVEVLATRDERDRPRFVPLSDRARQAAAKRFADSLYGRTISAFLANMLENSRLLCSGHGFVLQRQGSSLLVLEQIFRANQLDLQQLSWLYLVVRVDDRIDAHPGDAADVLADKIKAVLRTNFFALDAAAKILFLQFCVVLTKSENLGKWNLRDSLTKLALELVNELALDPDMLWPKEFSAVALAALRPCISSEDGIIGERVIPELLELLMSQMTLGKILNGNDDKKEDQDASG